MATESVAETEPIDVWVDPMLSVEPLPTVVVKKGDPLPDASAVLAFLKDAGVTVNGDTVNVKSNGTVEVDTDDVAALAAAWKTYAAPPPPPDPVETFRAEMADQLATITDVLDLRDWILAEVVPRLNR